MVRGFSGAFWELRRKQQPWLRSRLNSACRHLMIWMVSGGQATPQVFLTDPGPHCPQRVMGTLGVPVREVGGGKGASRPGAPRSGCESLGRPAGDARVGVCVLSQTQTDKQRFLRAVEILSDAVRAQANGSMDEYFPKAVLAKKIEVRETRSDGGGPGDVGAVSPRGVCGPFWLFQTLILEEASELLTSNVRQQAMLCVVALSQVNPPFSLSQKLDLVNVGVVRVFALPHARRSVDEMDSASLYAQTVQAFEDMLQALVMDGLDPDMTILQKVLEHMAEFSIVGTLMGTLGVFCLNPQHDVCTGASEGLHYLFTVLVLHRRRAKQKTEVLLRDLQKHFHGAWFAHMQDLTMFFRKYLTPEERADVILVAMEAMATTSRNDGSGASKMLTAILKSPMADIGKVPEIIQYICHRTRGVTETTAQATIRDLLCLLARTYTDEVVLVLFKIQDQSRSSRVRRLWEMLASVPRGYEEIMESLQQRMTQRPEPGAPEPRDRRQISPLMATRAIHELLLEPRQRVEVQSLFASLFMALLLRTSFLVAVGGTEPSWDQQHGAESMDPMSSTVDALKALMRSAGYGDHVSYVQKLGGWELLASRERHHEGVALLARAMVIKSCWHNRPVFSLVIGALQAHDRTDHLTALTFATELLRCPDVAATVDNVTIHILAGWFQSEDPVVVKQMLQVVETFAKHGNMARQLRLLQPYVLNCCYSQDSDIVMETFLMLQGVVQYLTWQRSSSFLVQLSFMLRPFFEEESERLRLAAFKIYEGILAKVKRGFLAFPLKHHVLNLIVLLVLHLEDRDADVAQVCRLTLCHMATALGWSGLKVTFAKKDMWMILKALLEQEAGKAIWFLRQCMTLFKSPQAPIRHAAVWFAGQIIQTLDMDKDGETEEAYSALQSLREDPDPMVSCLATQICYVLEAKETPSAPPPTSCFCTGRP
ncbi:maestro heat-like repeat-containing protein family member 7 isoform X4 [Pteropus medius]|uniref:maestro heat-like repeat-containing protein family member 7 isoform X4 n=1 Tax=Pteropus vampyrus TaxID=132908 RepID=UPI00196B5716|nr:maestro heat-like repeat-containing protein family member 7 isoform X4 [Pteropus giganteus]